MKKVQKSAILSQNCEISNNMVCATYKCSGQTVHVLRHPIGCTDQFRIGGGRFSDSTKACLKIMMAGVNNSEF